MKPYKRLFTIDDIKDSFGYDLVDIATLGGFDSKEASAESWCDEAALSIHNEIVANRGWAFSKAIYDVVTKEKEDGQDDLYEAIKMAQMYEMLFIIENGNSNASNKIENVKKHSEIAINTLINVGILALGF